MARRISPGLQRRSDRRLARIRINNPKALGGIRKGGISLREARKIKRVDSRQRLKAAQKKAAKTYNPLAPLTGAREKAEISAAEKMQFGPKEAELRRARASQDAFKQNLGTYYDDYKASLAAASDRIQAQGDANVKATEGRVDTAFKEDKAAVAERDRQATEAAAKLGQGPVRSEEGARAVEAQRSQGNQAAAEVRNRASSDSKLTRLQVANSVLGKIERLSTEERKSRALDREGQDLADAKGAFRTDLRRKLREGEREWAAVKTEFGLKERDLSIKAKDSAADRSVERQKVAAQKIVARLYSSADRKSARAQIRVAELQLKKGKISKNQFKTIRNIYEGLPGGGSGGGKPGKTPKGSGAGGAYAPWEKDKITNAARILRKNKASLKDRDTWIARMEDEGVPRRLAAAAWRRYVKKHLTQPDRPSTTKGPGGQQRPN